MLGPAYSDAEIEQFLDSVGAAYHHIPDDSALHGSIADRLAEGQVIGFLQGAMEFGPRALGARSLLGDPRNPVMQSDMNLKVKFRESFRPFAPAVLREHVHEWFGTRTAEDSPYMLFVAPVNDEHRRPLTSEEQARKGIDKLMTLRSSVPAITHVDYSARIQTVDAERHGPYHGVIEAFYQKTGCPVIVNTSFNLGWAPIVCSPFDAYETFMASEIDALCMGHYVLAKRDQPAEVRVAAAPGLDGYTQAPWACPCGQGPSLERTGDTLRCRSCSAGLPHRRRCAAVGDSGWRRHRFGSRAPPRAVRRRTRVPHLRRLRVTAHPDRLLPQGPGRTDAGRQHPLQRACTRGGLR